MPWKTTTVSLVNLKSRAILDSRVTLTSNLELVTTPQDAYDIIAGLADQNAMNIIDKAKADELYAQARTRFTPAESWATTHYSANLTGHPGNLIFSYVEGDFDNPDTSYHETSDATVEPSASFVSSLQNLFPLINFDALLMMRIKDLVPWVYYGYIKAPMNQPVIYDWNFWTHPDPENVTVYEFILDWSKVLTTYTKRLHFKFLVHLFFEKLLGIVTLAALKKPCIQSTDGLGNIASIRYGNNSGPSRFYYRIVFPMYTYLKGATRDNRITIPMNKELNAYTTNNPLKKIIIDGKTYDHKAYEDITFPGELSSPMMLTTEIQFSPAGSSYNRYYLTSQACYPIIDHATFLTALQRWTSGGIHNAIVEPMNWTQQTSYFTNTLHWYLSPSATYQPAITFSATPENIDKNERTRTLLSTDALSDSWFDDDSSFSYVNTLKKEVMVCADDPMEIAISKITISDILSANETTLQDLMNNPSIENKALLEVYLKDMQVSTDLLNDLSEKFSDLAVVGEQYMAGAIGSNVLTSENTQRTLSETATMFQSSIVSFANDIPETSHTLREIKAELVSAFQFSGSDPFRNLQITLSSITDVIRKLGLRKTKRISLLGGLIDKLKTFPDISRCLDKVLSGLGDMFHTMVSSIGNVLLAFLQSVTSTVLSTISIVENIYKIYATIEVGITPLKGKIFTNTSDSTKFCYFLFPKDKIPANQNDYVIPVELGANTRFPQYQIGKEIFTLAKRTINASDKVKLNDILDSSTDDLTKLISLMTLSRNMNKVYYNPSPECHAVAAGLVAAQAAAASAAALANGSIFTGWIAAAAAATTIAVTNSVAAGIYLSNAANNPHDKYLVDRTDYSEIISGSASKKIAKIPLNAFFSMPYSDMYKAWLISKDVIAIVGGFAAATAIGYGLSRLTMAVNKRIEARKLTKLAKQKEFITINGVDVPTTGFSNSQLKRHVTGSLSGKYTGRFDPVASTVSTQIAAFTSASINKLKMGVGRLFGIDAKPATNTQIYDSISDVSRDIAKATSKIDQLSAESTDIKTSVSVVQDSLNTISTDISDTSSKVDANLALATTSFASITATLAASTASDIEIKKLLKLILSRQAY